MKHGRNTDKSDKTQKNRKKIGPFSYPCLVRVSSVAGFWNHAELPSAVARHGTAGKAQAGALTLLVPKKTALPDREGCS
jgi:hypothetical protein